MKADKKAKSEKVSSSKASPPKAAKKTVNARAGSTTKKATPVKKAASAASGGKVAEKSSKYGANKSTKAKKSVGTLVSSAVAGEIAKRLCALYPDADCELNFDNDYQLITAVILSAQCTDQQVNKVAARLFKQFPNARDLAEADIEVIKEIVKPTGYFNAKAKNIQACAQAIVTKYGGVVPRTLEELVTLPGVGRKTANVVLGVAHNIPGWTVDTHVQRLSQRLGLTKQTDPYKIELDLQKLFPTDKFDWTKLSITIIWHGRRCCYARKPDCGRCPVNELCPASEV